MLFDNNKIKIDPTNNMVPRRNISKNTGHKINEDILNYIEEEGLGSNDEEDDEDNDDEDSNDFINRLLMEEAEKEKEGKD